MNLFTDLIQKTPRSDEMPVIPEITVPKSYENYLKWQCETFNRTVGDLDGYDCPECLNRGCVYAIKDNVLVQRECKCMKIRKSPFRLEVSGLNQLKDLNRFTFELYNVTNEWQKYAKSMAMRYISENDGKWLFLGGQSGAGKTHLCTAVCKEFIMQGYDVKYVLWRDIVNFFNANRFKYDAYTEKMARLQNVDILYIDDFLKTTDKKQLANDLNYAYEIINLRATGKQTIISSEMFIDEITDLDEATGGRISKMSDGFQIQIKREKSRNYRFYGEE